MTDPGKHGFRGSNPLRQVSTSVAGVIIGFVVVVVAVFVGIKIFGGHDGHPAAASATPSQARTTQQHVIPVPKVPKAVFDKLPIADTDGKVAKAPVDLTKASGGQTIEIAQDTVGFAKAGANPITRIPKRQFGETTWLPVLRTYDGWAQVRLPARPNGATAWIPEAGHNRARTSWAATVRLTKGTMTVTHDGTSQGTWPIGQGKNATPTPVGQTFLISGFVDPNQSFSPVIYALGTHSATLDSYGGGPGTVAVHGWPTEAGREGKVSHGCVRVPSAALEMFAKLPTGTPVDIVK